ncbi:MAG: drug/metabolite exporter YedA [Anaerolineae bacterium]
MTKRNMGTPALWQVLVAFAAVYLIWGSTYLAIRYAVETIPPFLMAGTRFVIPGALLFVFLRARGVPMPTRSQWKAAAIIGGLLLLGGNGFVSWSEQRVPSGIAALLVAMVPLWMTLLEAIRSRTIPRAQIIAGLALGLAGILLLVGPGEFTSAGARIDLIGLGGLIVASISWAIGSLYARHADLPHAPLMGTAIEMLMGGLLLWMVGLGQGEAARVQFAHISTSSLLGVLYLIFFGSLGGFSAYTWLLRVTTPARASTYAYVNPVVAVFLGWAIAGEPLTIQTIVATAIIIGSVVLITTSRSAAGSADHSGPAIEGGLAEAQAPISE